MRRRAEELTGGDPELKRGGEEISTNHKGAEILLIACGAANTVLQTSNTYFFVLVVR